MGPLLLRPNYISPVWSGPRVNEARGIAGDVLYGESFDVSVHEGLVNIVEGGPHDGTPLDELVREHAAQIMGDLAGEDGTVQVLVMDAAQNLSVQVHPDEAYARAREGDHEKTESWYILAAEPGAFIYCGTTTDDVDALRSAAADDTIGDRYCRKVPVSEGDFILIPAGTLHALGAGVFALEVGSLGFKTYRICDWGRGRELHVRQGFDVLQTGCRPEPNHLGPFDPSVPAGVRRGVTHRLFVSDVVDVRGSWERQMDGRYEVLSCVAGTALVRTAEGSVELPYTRSLLMPASAGSYVIEGTCRVLRSYAMRPGEVA
ncbi:class I mannose-6-phosphate isomerase [Thermophilibacter sp. ET337]|uniref:class I mannose-6-phosphate isomerase n=1 Tax=Thermophilibacter sp. ET337 TaxID=2973084 RepID=UPI0021AC909C|nr:class I mannose-6-phosphate isomerase [Thermophilibacter sp. ET337]MCR8908169.1 class I mannose-6-phosphate isomerase [Thermophilibacter sp. ET337]